MSIEEKTKRALMMGLLKKFFYTSIIDVLFEKISAIIFRNENFNRLLPYNRLFNSKKFRPEKRKEGSVINS